MKIKRSGQEVFKPARKELKKEYCLRLEKGRMSALEGNQENASSGKQNDSVQRENLQLPPR